MSASIGPNVSRGSIGKAARHYHGVVVLGVAAVTSPFVQPSQKE